MSGSAPAGTEVPGKTRASAGPKDCKAVRAQEMCRAHSVHLLPLPHPMEHNMGCAFPVQKGWVGPAGEEFWWDWVWSSVAASQW